MTWGVHLDLNLVLFRMSYELNLFQNFNKKNVKWGGGTYHTPFLSN